MNAIERETPEMALASERERLRCVGVVLGASATFQLAGDKRVAHILAQLALRLEHPELEAGK